MLKKIKRIKSYIWFFVFFVSLCLHLGLIFYLSHKDKLNLELVPEYNSRDLQLVIFDKQNKKKNNDTKFLAKYNYATDKERKIKELASSMMMAETNNTVKEIAERLQKESGSMDFLPDVEYGDVMSLNTRAFKYYGFYERVEKVLSPYWAYKVRALLRNKPELFKNSITKDYIAEIRAIINKDGELVKIILLKSSKIKEFDLLCESMFVELSPFMNPPKALLKNGLISMNWRFILSVVKDFSFKIEGF